jgi:hypothetical protein
VFHQNRVDDDPTTREMPRNCHSGPNCKQFRRLGNLLHICKQTKSIIHVDVLRIYFTIPVPLPMLPRNFVCLNFHYSRPPCPILPQHEESRQRSISRNLEESRPCGSWSSTKNLVHDNRQEVRTLNYFSRGIFSGYLVHDWVSCPP